MNLQKLNAIIKHTWAEPKFVAQVEWWNEYPSLSMQLEQQIGRGAMVQFISGGGWPNPDQEIEFVQYEEPDWDWYEPTTEWRRKAARDRELDAILASYERTNLLQS